MIITHHDGTVIKFATPATTILYNPTSKKQKKKGDIILTSVGFPPQGEGFHIHTPGEYEVRGVTVRGVGVVETLKEKEIINTCYIFELDGIRIGVLGLLSKKTLDTDVIDVLSGADLLFVPIGDEGTLTPADAYSISVQLGPRVIIPTAYENSKGALKKFLSAHGGSATETTERYTPKRSSFSGERSQSAIDLIVLTYS